MVDRYPENIVSAWEHEAKPLELHRAAGLIASEPSRALPILLELANEGSLLSMYFLGDTCLYGRGIQLDVEGGLSWLGKAASGGLIEAAYALAFHYRTNGETDRAKVELLKLGERGFSPAWHTLAKMYYYGNGVEKDKFQAVEYWKRAEACGHLYAKRNLSVVMRSENEICITKIRGFAKLLMVMFPFVYYQVQYKDSDRIRDW